MINHQLVDEAMELGNRLLLLADEGDQKCTQDSCLVLFGVVRDCGYKIFSEVTKCRQGLDAVESPDCLQMKRIAK